MFVTFNYNMLYATLIITSEGQLHALAMTPILM